jgi:hypothetical protein
MQDSEKMNETEENENEPVYCEECGSELEDDEILMSETETEDGQETRYLCENCRGKEQ